MSLHRRLGGAPTAPTAQEDKEKKLSIPDRVERLDEQFNPVRRLLGEMERAIGVGGQSFGKTSHLKDEEEEDEAPGGPENQFMRFFRSLKRGGERPIRDVLLGGRGLRDLFKDRLQ